MATLALTTHRIKLLVDRLERGDHPDRERVEKTLTDGYAWALNLDAECRRLERRISVDAERLAHGASVERARELSALARLLKRRRRQLDGLRHLLAVLRADVQEATVVGR